MSALEFKPGDTVRVVKASGSDGNLAIGDEHVVKRVNSAGDVSWGGQVWARERFVKVEPEFVVGQQVSGDDYAHLPVGTRVEDKYGPALVKVEGDAWRYANDPDAISHPSSDWSDARTIARLPATEPEDKDDLYVEPEPLKEAPRDVYPARPVRLTDRLGAILFDGMATVEWTSTGAIGTITPVKPAQCTSLYEQGHYLVRCTALGSHEAHRDGLAETWTDAEAYGRVEVVS